jgi:AcrR family transcriptional regulator
MATRKPAARPMSKADVAQKKMRADGTNKRRQLVDAEIYNVAANLFATKGYANTSLQDIADGLGLSRPALYHYVRSKEDILEKLVAEFTELKAHEHASVISDRHLDAKAKLRHMVTSTVRSIAQHPERFRLLDRYENELPEAVMTKQRAAKRAVRDAFVSVINEGVSTGQFRAVDPSITAFGLIGMCTWVAWWFSSASASDVEKTVSTLGELALRSVLRGDPALPATADPVTLLNAIREQFDRLETMLTD